MPATVTSTAGAPSASVVTVHTRNRPTSAASGSTEASTLRASGPCTARTARVEVTSAMVSSPTESAPSAASTPEVLDALGMTSKRCSATHHTMMSSETDPSSANRWVYCARPGWIFVRSLVKAA